MIIDLLPVIGGDGREMPACGKLDFSNKKEVGAEFPNPVLVEGKIINIGGQLEFSGTIFAKLKFMCDRCGEWFYKELEIPFSEVLKKEMDKIKEGDENPDVIFYQGTRLDISEIIYNNIYMNFPTKLLCNDDCFGLCLSCGCNLNKEKCECKNDDTDPRFDVLDNFFKK